MGIERACLAVRGERSLPLALLLELHALLVVLVGQHPSKEASRIGRQSRLCRLERAHTPVASVHSPGGAREGMTKSEVQELALSLSKGAMSEVDAAGAGERAEAGADRRIRIVTDSMTGLPPELAREHDIGV